MKNRRLPILTLPAAALALVPTGVGGQSTPPPPVCPPVPCVAVSPPGPPSLPPITLAPRPRQVPWKMVWPPYPVQPKETYDRIAGRYFSTWRGVRHETDRGVTEGDKNINQCDHVFRPDGGESVLVNGEISPAWWSGETRIDVTADPMRIDEIVVGAMTEKLARPHRHLGVFKFDGRRLVVHFGPGRYADLPVEDDERPKDFKPTKHTTVVTYE